jgi:hypothetical protein
VRPILDFHTHPWRPEDFAATTTIFIRRISPAVREHGDRLHDPVFAADLLRREGVQHAVMLAEHCPLTSGNVRTETVLELCHASGGFFLPFASVDPMTDEDPAGLLRRYVELGVRGLKLYPSYQFHYPNDPRNYPLYEICQAACLPVLMHIGSSVMPGTRMKYCDPIRLDDVAVDFPDLRLVMAHGGRGFWHAECAFLAAHHANLYIDLAGLVPARLLEHFPDLERLSHKVVFGSDWPAMPKSVEHNVTAIGALGLSEDALDRILFRNAAALLGLAREADH